MKQMMGGMMGGGGAGIQSAWAQPPPSGYATGLGPMNVQGGGAQGVGPNFGGGYGGGPHAYPQGAPQGPQNIEPYQQQMQGMFGGGGAQSVPLQTGVQGQMPGGGGGPMQGQMDAMMHPFAPRNRFPGALQRGIMQAMPQPPPPPAPYGGQQFRMW
jgi:hypothetical protein